MDRGNESGWKRLEEEESVSAYTANPPPGGDKLSPPDASSIPPPIGGYPPTQGYHDPLPTQNISQEVGFLHNYYILNEINH